MGHEIFAFGSTSIQRVLVVMGLASVVSVAGCGESTAGNSTPSGCPDSTYATIQESIFEAKGCTQSICHGESAEGGLDLRSEASHASLVRRASSVDPSLKRVLPGDQDSSLLYLKLEAGLNGTDLGPLGQAMPASGEPVTKDELEAIRLWIRGGARAKGLVAGTMERLECEGTFDPDPNKIEPLPPPEDGLQFYSGAWSLPAESEDEVCFATYYDFSDEVPEELQVDCGELAPGRKCFPFRRSEVAQDGQSHHAITSVYIPESDPNGGDWIDWQCLGGDQDGNACDPTAQGVCGSRSKCATPVQTSIACLNYFFGPLDFSSGAGVDGASDTRERLATAQESIFVEELPTGVYSLLPIQGFVAWNSHAFNLTRKDTTIEQWVNLTYARGSDERRWQRQQIFDSDQIFGMGTIAPFEKKEVCTTFTLPVHSRLMTLSSHFHQRGELFRIWLPPNERCSGVRNCEAPARPPDYESRLYNDPVEISYLESGAIRLDSEDSDERTFKSCAVYDNGADDPLEVKRHSTRPNAPSCGHSAAHCGCTASTRACLGGDSQGARCDGDDAVCGADSVCDACPLEGGVTTDDEMFITFGSYYVEAVQ